MTYKIMDGGFCVDKGLVLLHDAQNKAEDYCRESDVDTISIINEETGETVLTGHAVFAMNWEGKQ